MTRVAGIVWILIAGVVLLGGTSHAFAATSPSVASGAVSNDNSSSDNPRLDPYLGGDLSSMVPTATRCTDNGQCSSLPNGQPCDTPIGCICGFSGGKRACGRF